MPTSSGSTRASALLRVEDLAAGYGAVPILHGIDLQVGRGEVVSVIGPNGAGKSTLLKAIMGKIAAMQGRIQFDGRDITHMPDHLRARLGLGYVPQTKDVFETLTVRENLEMGGYQLPKAQLPPQVDRVLSMFRDLEPMALRVASKLSGGERKMLAVARVLMLEPSVLVLDEPTSNLSPALSRTVLRDQARRLADGGVAVLLVEQKAFEALKISDWAYVLVTGTTSISGRAGDLLARDDIRETFLGGVQPASISTAADTRRTSD
jgi:ABC-type branched-subunit amino acid transport system ATPase component